MNDKDIELIIEIKYKDKVITISENNQKEFEELISESIQQFGIEQKLQNKIIFTTLDDNGNTKRIKNNNDIIKYSKEKTEEQYYIKINLEISEQEKNNSNNEINECGESIDSTEYEKKLEKIKNEKDKKIKELEEKIEKMKKEHSLEIKKVKSEKNTEKGKSTSIKEENNNFDKKKIEELIIGVFKKEKEKFSSEIQKIKNDIISEIKKELPKENDNNSNNNEFDEVKKQINTINNSLDENIKTISNIKNDLSIVKDKIKKIEVKENEMGNEKDNEKENDNNENKINNNYYCNYIPFMNMNKIYKCLNCNNLFPSNECINNENKVFKEHNFHLQNPENNNDGKR